MIDLRFRPLEKWPGELAGIKPAFKMKYDKTLDALEYELRKLNASNVMVEAGFALQQIRNDGWPHSGARPAHAGVVLYFDSAEGPMRFPCGNYNSWTANLHAIALTLENLRAIDRYGVTVTHQQYAGFKMLPAADSRATVQHAATILAGIAVRPVDYILEDAECFRQAYRLAARKCHPDQTTGREAEWNDLQRAKTVLEAYFSTVAVSVKS